jgi:hypothetical protein
MSAYNIVHVAIVPPVTPDANLIEKVAAIVNKNTSETRSLLTSVIPRIIAHYPSMQAAESAAQSLREAGLMTIVLNDFELRKPSQVFRLQTLEFGDGEVLFRDQAGQVRKMTARDVFLIIEGKRPTYVETEVSQTKMKFSLGATILTGGIPVWRQVKEKISDRPVQIERFARLYDRKSSEQSIELLQHNMNYSFLGAKKSPSSLANFDIVITLLRELFPQATFDDRLMKLARRDEPFQDVKVLSFPRTRFVQITPEWWNEPRLLLSHQWLDPSRRLNDFEPGL